MKSPLNYDEIEDIQLKAQFKELHILAFQTSRTWSEEEVAALMERLHQEVAAKPILARIVSNKSSLLDIALLLTDGDSSEVSIPTIEALIDANPSALLWGTHDDYPINIISSHPQLCTLMPLIATKHRWVLDHEKIIDDPPVITLIHLLQSTMKQSRSSTATTMMRGIAETIRRFFEAYPHSLTQKDSKGLSPLHLIVGSRNVNLIKRMVELCPSSMKMRTNRGNTPLHMACLYLTKILADDMKEVCKLLISKCPESVRCANSRGDKYPIHYLLKYCQHQPVREVIVCLLRSYPESYNISSDEGAPSSILFIQHVNFLLDEERSLQENIAQLQLIPGAFDNAVECTRDDLMKSTSTVFNAWAKSSIQAMESKIERNSSLLQLACDYIVEGYPIESDDE